MSKLNNQEDTRVHEVTYILKRKITRQNKKITGVSRSFEVNGEIIHSDNISREVFFNTLDNPDIFRLVELFTMGELNVGQHTANRTENRKYFAEPFESIRRELLSIRKPTKPLNKRLSQSPDYHLPFVVYRSISLCHLLR